MPIFYNLGINRIIYRSEGFSEGKTVTAYLWSPTLSKSDLQTFTELNSGIYYLDYNFDFDGSYIIIFYENSIPKTAEAYRITALVDNVWDESMIGHNPTESFGESIHRIRGLSQENYRIVNTVYNSKNNLIQALIKIYATAEDCDNDMNILASYTVHASYDATGALMQTYKVTKD